jgi:hypothetical protein
MLMLFTHAMHWGIRTNGILEEAGIIVVLGASY